MQDQSIEQQSVNDDLKVEEYKSLKALVEKYIENINKSEIYAIAAFSAVSTYNLSLKDALIEKATSFIPLAIAVVGLVRFIGFNNTLKHINNYIKTVEEKCPSIGWVQYYRSNNKALFIQRTRYAIWICLVLLSVALLAHAFRILPAGP